MVAGDRYKQKLSNFFARAKTHFNRGLETVSDDNESEEEKEKKEEDKIEAKSPEVTSEEEK